MPSPKSILVRAPNWIGDHVMALPFYQGLREAYPTATFILLARENLRTLTFPEVFSETHFLTGEEHVFPGGVWKAAGRLNAELSSRPDLAINLPASFSSAFLLWKMGIERRVGFARGLSSLFLTEPLTWQGRAAHLHKRDQYLQLLKLIAGNIPAIQIPKLNGSSCEKYFVVAPGASLPLREYPYFPELLITLRNAYPQYTVRLVGTAADEKFVSMAARLGDGKIENWIGRTSLPELIELCKKSSLVVANDSGVAHLAATLAEAPTLVLFGPGDPDYVAPLGSQVKVARASEVRCSPCERAYCRAPFGYQRCLRALTVPRVLESVSELLSL